MNDSQQYQVAPNGGYNYYPQNLQKRVQINNSYAVPITKSNNTKIFLTLNISKFSSKLSKSVDFKLPGA